MGCCSSISSSQAGSHNSGHGPRRIAIPSQYRPPLSVQVAMRNNNEEEKKSISKILDGQFTGEGIKKTPAFETHLSKAEFEKFREEFWGTRVEGDFRVWNLLRQACEADTETAEVLMQAADVGVDSNGMTICFDSTGRIYSLPISIINEPVKYNEKVIPSFADSIQNVKQAKLKLKLRTMDQKDTEIEIDNTKSIKELKEMYLEAVGSTMDDLPKIRLFCIGKELKNEFSIHSQKLTKDLVIQVLFHKNL